jgi:ParB/RepB/Spo0J family partition protein
MSKHEDQTQKESQQKYWEVDARNIKPLDRAGGNIRHDYGDQDGSFKELVDSIRENGILVPLRAYRDKDNEGHWISIDGHRRMAAAKWLLENEGLEIRVRVIVVDARKISDEQLIYDMVTTNSGKPLSPIELAEAVRRLQAYGHKPKEIAKKFGKTVDLINNLSLFASAPKRLRDLVAANRVSYSLVLDVLKETKDFNQALDKIENALAISKQEAKSKSKSKDADYDPETDTSEPLEYKATKKHLDQATNRVDSLKELSMVIRSMEEAKETPLNKSLYDFARAIVKNQFTATDIKNLFNKL